MDEPAQESLWMRLIWMIILSVLISFAQTVLMFATVLQFVLMLFNHHRPNAQIAWFGQSLGKWMATAVRYQTAAAEEKPWPWAPFD